MVGLPSALQLEPQVRSAIESLNQRRRDGSLRGGKRASNQQFRTGQLSHATVVRLHGQATARGSRRAVADMALSCSLSGCDIVASDGLMGVLVDPAA
jgi:hypothetical protein